jgi:hypothetical protein
MNKTDTKLIIILICISIIAIITIKKKEETTAVVYYQNNAILNIDLNIDSLYEVDGTNGKVKIKVKDKKIKVESENSKKHICSKQGYISHSYESIICLPNEIVIKIKNNDEIDAKVG